MIVRHEIGSYGCYPRSKLDPHSTGNWTRLTVVGAVELATVFEPTSALWDRDRPHRRPSDPVFWILSLDCIARCYHLRVCASSWRRAYGNNFPFYGWGGREWRGPPPWGNGHAVSASVGLHRTRDSKIARKPVAFLLQWPSGHSPQTRMVATLFFQTVKNVVP